MIEFFLSLAPWIIAIALVILLWFWFGRQRRPRRQPRPDEPPRWLQRKLLRQLGGDRAVVERLIRREKLKTPGRSEAWYWEKVLSDLERDRRY